MCGIWGWQWHEGAKVNAYERAVLSLKLAEGNDKRGGQSWGYYSTLQNKLKKGMGRADYQSVFMAQHMSLFGHSRWATHGDKTAENSHPFDFAKLVGAHNGIIYNHYELNKKYERKFEVDSQHIFQHMLEGKDPKELEGYGTIVWTNREEPRRIFLCRMTSGGQLTVFQTKHGVIWSSDGDHLKDALAYAGMKKHLEYEVKAGQVYTVENGKFFVMTDRQFEISGRKVDVRTQGGNYSSGYSSGYPTYNGRYVSNYGTPWDKMETGLSLLDDPEETPPHGLDVKATVSADGSVATVEVKDPAKEALDKTTSTKLTKDMQEYRELFMARELTRNRLDELKRIGTLDAKLYDEAINAMYICDDPTWVLMDTDPEWRKTEEAIYARLDEAFPLNASSRITGTTKSVKQAS